MIIGICGGTGSGKTTIARKIVEEVGEENVILVEQDSYYLNLADLPLNERRTVNFDHPDSIDSDSLVELIENLKAGKPAEMPVYDFKTHTRSAESKHFEPKPIVIVEGILIFALPEVLELLDVKVFIDTPDDIRLLRRINRDVQERGRTIEQTVRQYEKTIRPMHYQFVAPSKSNADIVVSNDEQTPVVVKLLSSMINEHLRDAAKSATT